MFLLPGDKAFRRSPLEQPPISGLSRLEGEGTPSSTLLPCLWHPRTGAVRTPPEGSFSSLGLREKGLYPEPRLCPWSLQAPGHDCPLASGSYHLHDLCKRLSFPLPGSLLASAGTKVPPVLTLRAACRPQLGSHSSSFPPPSARKQRYLGPHETTVPLCPLGLPGTSLVYRTGPGGVSEGRRRFGRIRRHEEGEWQEGAPWTVREAQAEA